MSWIDEYAKGSFQLYSGNIIDAFQPLDFFHFYPLWYDLWIVRFMRVMDVLDCDHKQYKDLKALLPGPSSMRAILQKLIPAAKGLQGKEAASFARMANFFARMLEESGPEDPFGNRANPVHTGTEAGEIIRTLPWQPANPEIAKQLGKLITAAGSLVHGLYNDVVTDFGWDAYGPYNIFTPGKNHQMIIRHFPDLTPADIWEARLLTPVRELEIFQFYEAVKWQLAFLGCHTVLKAGNPITGLTHFAVRINGQFMSAHSLSAITDELADKAEALYGEIRKKNFEELKNLVMLQECYQLKKMFTAAYMNWLPTPEMYDRIRGKPLVSGILPHGKMMTNETEYKDLFHLNWFKREILNSSPTIPPPK